MNLLFLQTSRDHPLLCRYVEQPTEYRSVCRGKLSFFYELQLSQMSVKWDTYLEWDGVFAQLLSDSWRNRSPTVPAPDAERFSERSMSKLARER
jgi:hypothetical protein